MKEKPSRGRGPQKVGYVFSVAQIFNLLYHRIAVCCPLTITCAFELSDVPPITNRRYGRLQICATKPSRALNAYKRELCGGREKVMQATSHPSAAAKIAGRRQDTP